MQTTLCLQSLCWLVVALGAVGAAPGGAVAQVHREALPKSIEPLVAATFADRGDGVLWEGRVAVPQTAYMRLHFTDIVSPRGASYSVLIRAGAADRLIARYPADVFGRTRSFFTDVLFADAVKVQVEGTPPLAGLSFRLDRILHQTDLTGRLTPHSAVPAWYSMAELRPPTPALKLADAVAKLYIGEGWTCTGFLIAPEMLVTNFHCLELSTAYKDTAGRTEPACDDIFIHFDFDRQPSPESGPRTPCRRVRAQDGELDVAVLELDPGRIVVDRASRGYLRLSERERPTTGEIFVIHHPAGLAKKVSLRCSSFLGNDPKVLEHDCSTLGGSSGSPVLAPDGTVVALHFGGAYPLDLTVREIETMIRDGKVFRNRARPVNLLRERLKAFIP